MDESDHAERIRRLKQKIRAEIEGREDVSGFEFKSTDDPGIQIIIEETDQHKLYNVTLEKLPDGTEETHWSYLGNVHED